MIRKVKLIGLKNTERSISEKYNFTYKKFEENLGT